jgi:hypothetical protein
MDTHEEQRDVDFEISHKHIEALKNIDQIADDGEHSAFPFFTGTRS